MVDRKLIFGGGGGGDSPTRTDDNLRSEDSAELLIGVCEGPIKGLENGYKSFFVDETPLQADDDSYNYQEFNLDIRKGEPVEDPIKLELGGYVRATNVGIELKKDTPVTRVTQSGEIDYIDVRIAVNRLYYSSDDGTFNSEVSFRIEYKKVSDPNWILYQNKPMTIEGKTTSTYMKDYRIAVDRDPETSYEVRVTKITEDGEESADGQGHFINIAFQSFEEVISDEKSFPYTAIAHLNIRTSDQINQMPQFSGIYECMIVKVPSNYDPKERTYEGEWDGTFKLEYTDNPAWCLYDLIMNDEHGVNRYFPVNADKWDFYEAAKYCDELVTDGRGGFEPRYTLNLTIQDAQSGFEVLQYVASAFNGTIYEDGSNFIRLTYDRAKEATHLFTKENVGVGGFSYSFSEPSTRFNDITVTFTNSNSNWEEDRRRVYDQENIDIWGRVTEDFQAVGCIKESEALRRARFRMIGSLTEVMSVNFTTNRVAQNISVFDTILVSDPDMNYSISGRFKSVGEKRTSVTLRDPVFLEARADYVCAIQTPTGIVHVEVDVREVGQVYELYFKDYLPDNLPDKAVFSLESPDDSKGSPKPFKVLAISESEGEPDKVSITAIEINRNKQYEADNNLDITEIEPSIRPNYNIVPHVLDVSFSEVYVKSTKETQLIITPILDRERYPYYSGSFRVWSRPNEQNPSYATNHAWQEGTLHYGDTLINHPSGLYDFVVLPLSTLGTTPNFDTAPVFVHDVTDLSKPPADVFNFQANGNINNILLTWDKVNDVDLIGYEIRLGDTWEDGEVIASFITDTSFYYNSKNPNSQKFMIKAIDAFGVYSLNYTTAWGQLGEPADVKEFYATPNRDTIRFDWVAESENGVEYEVKVGQSWDSGITLFKTKGMNQTVLNPAGSERGFMIKAVTPAGVYSKNFRYAQPQLELHQNRNVILEIDNAQDNWSGVTNGLERTNFEDVLAMRDGYYYAEHYFDVNLNEVTRARNWFETEGFKFGERLTFEDLNYTWGSGEAAQQNWLNTTGLNSVNGEIQAVISYQLTSDYLNYIGLSLNNTTEEMNKKFKASLENEVTYSGAKYSNGVVLNKLLNLRYENLNIPSLFSIRCKIKLTNASSDYIKILRLSGNLNYWIDLSIENGKLILRRSDGVFGSNSFERFDNLEYLSIMITQTNDKIIVDYLPEYANISGRIEINCKPLGAFTKLYLGGRYE